MGKDLKGKEIGAGIVQQPNGTYFARFVDKFGKRRTKRSKKLQEVKQSKFSFNGVAGASHTGSVGTSALDHEAFDDPVEDQPVVKALIDQTDKVIYCIWGDFRIQLRFHDIAVFHRNGNYWICHNI